MTRYHLNTLSISPCDGGLRNQIRMMIKGIDIKIAAEKASSIDRSYSLSILGAGYLYLVDY